MTKSSKLFWLLSSEFLGHVGKRLDKKAKTDFCGVINLGTNNLLQYTYCPMSSEGKGIRQ